MIYGFLSSPVRGLRDIREDIHDLALPDGRTIWVDEVDNPRTLTDPAFVTVDDLFARIREASVLLVLLGTERHGTGLEIAGHAAHVSYWETELFYAMLLGKDVQVFEQEGFAPDAKLGALLRMLQRVLPRSASSGPHKRDKIARAVQEFLLKRLSRKDPQPRSRLVGAIVDGLFHLRGRDGRGGMEEKESLEFVDGEFFDPTVSPKEELITHLLTEVKALTNEEGRLTRLWVLYRELQGAPFAERRFADFLPYWNWFFSEWASAGSWYGLHGHPHLAVLPAQVAQAKVREQMRSIGSSSWSTEDMGYPGGALASSRYSIASRSASFRNRRFLLRAALRDLQRSLNEGIENKTNLLAVRGSVYRKLGAVWAAVGDYEAVLKQRQKAGSPEVTIGEALSELGYGYLCQLRLWRGRSLLEEGVHLLRNHPGRSGFLIRATRKLAVAYAVTGELRKARQALQDVRDLAQTHGAFDQIH
jgi:tetratricopeptide (TPR) repeat protein